MKMKKSQLEKREIIKGMMMKTKKNLLEEQEERKANCYG